MRIGIDIRCLTDGKRTGVEEYTINLLENIFELDKKNEYILFLNSYRKSHFDERIFAHFKNVKVKRFHLPNKLLNFCFWYLRWPLADKMLGGVDIFFMPNINFIALSKKVKLILTVHDLSYEIFPETFSVKRRAWHGFINPRALCKRADQIIAVSDSSMADAIEHFNINEQKIQRIHNGVSEEMTELDRNDPKLIEVKERYHLPFNFIFYLGTVEPRKNIPAIVKAFDQLKKLNKPELNKYKLVIAGGMGWKIQDILKAGREAEFTNDIIFTSCITNEDKAAVYTLASLFVYPSFFEGFGIPVLEALRCGVSVITSNTSSLPEVVGSSAIMIDPDNPNELYLAMKEVLLDRKLSEHLELQSPRQAIRFNWRTSARETLIVFEKSLEA
ncbi:MAG: mannosyltransferase B-like protein [uncultured bacterium]|nr:MAG: mannosyltransferase B-like protein [uncultured bacterium]KKQ44761.1 MAG: Group 1 glycosyl transferase [Candidatus Moranbacteria bacterium GW2011_GWC2_37_8]KKQ61255.1 MAG: Group 1 glycosyl transferase [Parcubacteria group bacterium GW2011_GWC1_38_22]KKQ79696.1 MAG: Group 1 glycosyl transferase [Candidatus Moranbacteria bacterium GW2011_GWD2_38_7]